MNERLKELAEQANSHHDNFFDLNYKELDVFLEKFAELIVRECVEIVERYGTPDGYYIADEINRIMLNIRTDKPFGVEP